LQDNRKALAPLLRFASSACKVRLLLAWISSSHWKSMDWGWSLPALRLLRLQGAPAGWGESARIDLLGF